MQISAIAPKVSIYPKKQDGQTSQSPKVGVSNSLPCLSYDKIPSLAFTGHIPNLKTGASELSTLLKRIPGEVYHIEVLDKAKGQKVKALLGFSTSKFELIEPGMPKEKSLMIYSEQGKILGDVNLNFYHWHTEHESPFKGGLPKPFVRLHLLKNNAAEQYGGIGGNLIQASVEQSLKTKSKGRIYVNAFNAETIKNDPLVFYNKMGLTLESPYGGDVDIAKYIARASKQLNVDEEQFNALMKNVVRTDIKNLTNDEKAVAVYKTVAHHNQCRPDEVRLGVGDWMYLNDDAVKNVWVPKIKTDPIFSDSNRLK